LFTVHRSFIGRPTGHGPTLRAAGTGGISRTLASGDYLPIGWQLPAEVAAPTDPSSSRCYRADGTTVALDRASEGAL